MTLQLTVPNMACAVCAGKITQAVQTIDPTATIAADPSTKLVNIETQQPEAAIRSAIVAAGYTVAA
jgi:copper chaperone